MEWMLHVHMNKMGSQREKEHDHSCKYQKYDPFWEEFMNSQ
jgi:hypothetical protein